MTPDQFFARLLGAGFEDDVLETVHRISLKLKNPRRSPSEILDGLEHVGLSKTVAHLRNYTGAAQLEQQRWDRAESERARCAVLRSHRGWRRPSFGAACYVRFEALRVARLRRL